MMKRYSIILIFILITHLHLVTSSHPGKLEHPECFFPRNHIVCYQRLREGHHLWVRRKPVADRFARASYFWTTYLGDCDIMWHDYKKGKSEESGECKKDWYCFKHEQGISFPKSPANNTCGVLEIDSCKGTDCAHMLTETSCPIKTMRLYTIIFIIHFSSSQIEELDHLQCFYPKTHIVCYQRLREGHHIWVRRTPSTDQYVENSYFWTTYLGDCDVVWHEYKKGKNHESGECKQDWYCFEHEQGISFPKSPKNNTCAVLEIDSCKGAEKEKGTNRAGHGRYPLIRQCAQLLNVTET
ncbi:hypothetical protein HDE_01744 [Halotydeus destructor]|nr:hypothetical protein HDE_01744 [Halotydeus destructor]